MRSLSFPKYPKQQACDIFAIFQGKREGWNRFLPVDRYF